MNSTINPVKRMAGFSKEGKWHRKFESVNDVQIQPDLDKLEKTRKMSKKHTAFQV